jgi:membrane-associated phospholipid phosphatase
MVERHIRRTPRDEAVSVTAAAAEPVVARGLTWLASIAVLLAELIILVDRPLAHYCKQHANAIHDAIAAVSTLGEGAWYLVPSLLVFMIARFIVRRPAIAARGLFVFLGVALAGLAADILKILVGRSRPWALFREGAYDFWPLQLNADYQSFPSGHAACVAAAALTLAVIAPRYRVQLLLAALLVALTRVVIVAHYLSDVVAGATLAWLVVVTVQRAFARHGVPLGPAGGAGVGMLPSPFAQRVLDLRPNQMTIANVRSGETCTLASSVCSWPIAEVTPMSPQARDELSASDPSATLRSPDSGRSRREKATCNAPQGGHP